MTPVRGATPGDLDALATLWCEGWRDAHADLLPEALIGLRTLERFRARLEAHARDLRVAVRHGAVAGFTLILGEELNQFYVARDARGSDVAAVLMADALTRFARAGVRQAWLACAIGNGRAARFYEKHDWRSVGVRTVDIVADEGVIPLDVWRYEIPIGR